MKRFKVATFNLYNLVLPETRYYSNRKYSKNDYRKKVDWIAARLKEMDADVVGFQEVFHKEALKEVLAASGLGYDHVYVTEETGKQPVCGLASRFPLKESESNTDFPACIPKVLGESYSHFRRPLLRALLQVGQHKVNFFVVHLKSKRPDIPPGYDDATGEALGQAVSLAIRGSEAAAVRMCLVEKMKNNRRPVVVLGDLNDSATSVTTDMITGSGPQRRHDHEEKREIWDTLLYSTSHFERLRSYRDVYYTHIHDSHYDCLDHIFVSEEFFHRNRESVGAVEYMRVFNDHLVDRTAWRMGQPHWTSDHAQVLVSIRFRKS